MTADHGHHIPADAAECRTQVERFMRTLIGGNFADQPKAAADVIGGLIALVPALSPVMAVRRVAGGLFRINAKGDLASAAPDLRVRLCWAALEADPNIGQALKSAFSPLWREQQTAPFRVHGGSDAMEMLLGLGKGGVMRWVREEMLARWPAHTNAAIARVQGALAACTALLQCLLTEGSCEHGLISERTRELAAQALPGLQAMPSSVDGTLHRSCEEVRRFIAKLLDEAATYRSAGEWGQLHAQPHLPPGLADLELNHHYGDLEPVVGAAFEVAFDSGQVFQGRLDDQGYALLSAVPAGRYRLTLGEDARPWVPPTLPPDNAAFWKPKVKAAGAQQLRQMLAREATDRLRVEQAGPAGVPLGDCP